MKTATDCILKRPPPPEAYARINEEVEFILKPYRDAAIAIVSRYPSSYLLVMKEGLDLADASFLHIKQAQEAENAIRSFKEMAEEITRSVWKGHGYEHLLPPM